MPSEKAVLTLCHADPELSIFSQLCLWKHDLRNVTFWNQTEKHKYAKEDTDFSVHKVSPVFW